MKELNRVLRVLKMVLLMFAFAPCESWGQPMPPPPPPGQLLNVWQFSGTNYLSLRRSAPLSLTNVALVPTWDGNGLQVDSTNAAWITYAVVETNAHTNLDCLQGSVETWYMPSSSNRLVNWGTLLEVGTWSTNATGAWGLYTDGSNICFAAQSNGFSTNYLSAPINWNAGEWHHIMLTYSATNSSLYLEGQLVTNGPGVSLVPGPDVLTNGFSIGSDGNLGGTGMRQAHGVYNQLISYNYQVDADTIAENYAYDTQYVYPLPSGGGRLTLDSDSGPPTPPGDGSDTNSSGSGTTYSAPQYGSNDFWLEVLPLGTNGYNSDPNSITLLLHDTYQNTPYQIQFTTNLADPNWTTLQTYVGSADSDVTPVTFSMAGYSNVFFRAFNYTLDTDQSGLPDWWQLKYFGHVGIDPNDDPMNDGYSNLYKYLNGMNPNVAYTPPAPTGLNVVLSANASGTNAALSWNASPGPVVQYVISRADPTFDCYGLYDGLGSFQTVATTTNSSYVDSGSFTLGDPFDSFGYASEYHVTAIYPGSVSSAVADYPLFGNAPNPDYAVNAKLVRGPFGRWEFAFSTLPPGIQTIQVSWVGWFYSWAKTDGMLFSTTIPTNALVNNCYVIPDAEVTNYLGLLAFVQGVGPGGQTGPYTQAGYLSSDAPYFLDGRQHLQEMLAFFLRAASINHDYSYYDDYYRAYDYKYPGSSDFVELSFLYPDVMNGPIGNDVYGVALDDRAPFTYEYNVCLQSDWFYTGTNSVPNFSWQPDFNSIPVPPVLNQIATNVGGYWTTEYNPGNPIPGEGVEEFPPGDWGFTVSGDSSVSLLSNFKNVFGLNIETALTGFGDGTNLALAPGSSLSHGTVPLSTLYSQTAAPVLQTIGYYFAPIATTKTALISTNPLPLGQAYPVPLTSDSAEFKVTVSYDNIAYVPADDFAVTNETPLIIGSVGQPMVIGGWAKQKIVNGYANKFAYLGQYFDTNSYIISNSYTYTNIPAGIVSPYGEFLPTHAGTAVLSTLPDESQSNAVGQVQIQVLKLGLDVNHDGDIDLTYTGPDNTSSNQPMVFWANNNYDRYTLDSDDGVYYDDDVQVAGDYFTPNMPVPDYNFKDGAGNRVIPCDRDLQDFARLWVSGIDTNLIAKLPSGSTVTLSWGDVGSPNTNNPTIDLFTAADADGGIGYLTNSLSAGIQTENLLCPYIGRLGPGGNIQLNASMFSNSWAGSHFIWCGEAYGRGTLTLTIADASSNVLAQTVAYIQIVDIKQMYERWTVGDNLSIAPTNQARLAEDNFPPRLSPVPFQYGPATDANTPYILYVHGWNMPSWEKDRFAESAFKRLYWQGYQGRFGSFRWPTESGFKGISTLATNPSEKDNYDRSEYTAWKSGTGLLNKLNDLNAIYPGRVYLLAHSMGNVVAGEALRLSGSTHVVKTYVASQGAISAHTYDTNIANYSFSYVPFSLSAETPNIYGNWFGGNNGGGAEMVVNFYNTNDFALQRSVWQLNQLFKPDRQVHSGGFVWSYDYLGATNDPPPWNHFSKSDPLGANTVTFDIVDVLTNRYEVMALAAQSWTTALGATPGVHNVADNIYLGRSSPSRIWPVDATGNNYAAHFWHSAEFRGNNWQMQGYWSELLGSDAFNLK